MTQLQGWCAYIPPAPRPAIALTCIGPELSLQSIFESDQGRLKGDQCSRWCLIASFSSSKSNLRAALPAHCRTYPAHSAALPDVDWGISAGACCVGMRTRVWGRGGSESDFFSASSSSFGLGNLAMHKSDKRSTCNFRKKETYWTPC